MPKLLSRVFGLLAVALLHTAAVAGESSILFESQCAACHGAERLGGTGPALIPESLARLKPEAVEKTIAAGRPATKMPAFLDVLSKEDISALARFVLSPLAKTPKWGEAEIAASKIVFDASPAVSKPVFTSDPLNLFVVVEAGDHHASIVDGDSFTVIKRFETRFALHGGPKFTPDGRYVFFMSRDGWVSKFDLWGLRPVAEVRASINSRNIAISADGLHVAVASYLPNSLVILNSETLAVEKIFEVKDRKGRPSRVSAVYQAPRRNSFIAALKDVPEVWEIATDPNAKPIFSGFVHNYEQGMEEALPSTSGLFALRRIEVPEPIDDFFFDPEYRNLIGASRDGKKAYVVNLNVGRDIAAIDLPGMPHLGSGITWIWNGRPVLATPHLNAPLISILDMTDWHVIKTLKTDGPGFFMRSHENSPYVWADVSGGAHTRPHAHHRQAHAGNRQDHHSRSGAGGGPCRV